MNVHEYGRTHDKERRWLLARINATIGPLEARLHSLIAVQRWGITEADIRTVDIEHGAVHLWNGRWIQIGSGRTGLGRFKPAPDDWTPRIRFSDLHVEAAQADDREALDRL